MVAIQEQDALGPALVRIHTADGEVVGAGFLIEEDLLCTCAHVVAHALRLPQTPEEAPVEPVHLQFPLIRDESGTIRTAQATVTDWQRINEDDTGDVALLRLDRYVPGTRPVALVDGKQVWKHRFRLFGYPRHAEHGIWVSGILLAAQGAGWLQMEVDAGRPPITRGFSGSPVWDEKQGGVVGMAVAAQRGSHSSTAYLIPAESLADERMVNPGCPFRGLESFEEEDAAVFYGREEETERLLEATTMRALTLLIGSSGCGKSSLLKAGLIPALREAGATVSQLKPVTGQSPVIHLARELASIIEPEVRAVDQSRRRREYAAILRAAHRRGDGESAGSPPDVTTRESADTVSDPEEIQADLDDLAASVVDRSGDGGHVFVIDQFEEFAAIDPGGARELLAMLLSLAAAHTVGRNGRQGLRVIATVRPDSLDKLVFSSIRDVLSEAVELIAPLSRDRLRRAITGPVEALAGVRFESGLPERLLDDTANEPGRMPLVEFALTRLWEQRRESMLTNAAYDEMGGVAGALADYAETIYAEFSAKEAPDVQRLFVQLARPDERGDFIRSPARVQELDSALEPLAQRLGRTRLVVLTRSEDGEEIVELAHEALIHQWDRLRTWLSESRDFRAWQVQLRQDLDRWADQDSDAGGLLRGTMLASAVEQLSRHSQDITDAERKYIEASVRHQRRGVRRWRAAAAGFTVLALVATTLSVIAWRSQQRVEDQLRTQASKVLAQVAERRASTDPAAALQLALASWRTRPTPEAYGALLHQHVRARSLVHSYPTLWSDKFEEADASTDGRRLVIRTSSGGKQRLTLWTGLLEGHPRKRQLPGVPASSEPKADRVAMSNDGRTLALAASDGSVRLWDLSHPKSHRVLAEPDERGQVQSTALDFSEDDGRLLRLSHDLDGHEPHTVDAWETDSGRRLRVAEKLLPSQWSDLNAAFGRDPDTVALTGYDAEEGDNDATGKLVELSTGQTLRDFPRGESVLITRRGAAVVTKRTKGPKAVKDPDESYRLTSTTSDPGKSSTLPDWPAQADITDQYALNSNDNVAEGYVPITAIRSADGKAFEATVPRSEGKGTFESVAVAKRGDGTRMLVVTGKSVVVAKAHPAAIHDVEGEVIARDAHGAVAAENEGTVTLTDTVRGKSMGSVKISRWMGDDGVPGEALFTEDGRRLLIHSTDGRIRAFSVPGLRKVPFDLPGLRRRNGSPEETTAVQVRSIRGSEVLIFTGNALIRMDAAKGKPIGRPLVIARKAARISRLTLEAQVLPRPGHHEQAVVVESDGAVGVWDLHAGNRIASLHTGALSDGHKEIATLSEDGRRLATVGADGFIRQWSIDSENRVGPSISSGGVDLVGFGPRDTLVGYAGLTSGFRIWNSRTGDHLASLELLAGGERARIQGGRLLAGDDGRPERVELRGDVMYEQLCRNLARDYSKAERALLPVGTPPGPPCG